VSIGIPFVDGVEVLMKESLQSVEHVQSRIKLLDGEKLFLGIQKGRSEGLDETKDALHELLMYHSFFSMDIASHLEGGQQIESPESRYVSSFEWSVLEHSIGCLSDIGDVHCISYRGLIHDGRVLDVVQSVADAIHSKPNMRFGMIRASGMLNDPRIDLSLHPRSICRAPDEGERVWQIMVFEGRVFVFDIIRN
jgi:hypothetical protein